MDWKDYQEEVAEFFKSLGFSAETDKRIDGVRTMHDIDVLVTSSMSGFDIKWLVECKAWQSKVNKLHVIGLRQIVIDAGADRGIILSEAGFQSGAFEAANLTNVQVTSLEQLRAETSDAVGAVRLQDLYVRTQTAKHDYWDINKQDRIRLGLRGYLDPAAYSGTYVVDLCTSIINQSLCDQFPFEVYDIHLAMLVSETTSQSIPKSFGNRVEVADCLEPLILELEEKLKAANEAMNLEKG